MAKRAKSVQIVPGKKSAIYASGVAALLMFVSWLGQNVYEAQMSDEMAEIGKNIQFVNAEMSKALTWMLRFQDEIRKEKPDSEIILNSAIGYADVTGAIVDAASRVSFESPILKKHLEDHKKLAGVLRSEVRKRNIEGIELAASGLMMWFGGIGREAHEEMNRRAQEIGDKEQQGKRIFRISFVLASVLLGGTWWHTNRELLRS